MMRMDLRDFIYNNKKKLSIIAAVILLITIGVSMFFIIDNRLNSATVNITVSPTIARVKIGDNEYDAVGTYKMRPGEYGVEIYADGFVTKTGKLIVAADESIDVSLYLEPTEDNKDWYDTHPWDATAAGDIIANAETQSYFKLKNENSILDYVPYYNFNYSIGYENNCEKNGGGICLIVDADFGFQRYAVQYLQSTDQDLSFYYVRSKDYELPFRRLEVNVPDGLEFDDAASSMIASSEEYEAVNKVVDNYISDTFSLNGYVAKTLQVKKYSDQFFGVTIAVYEDDSNVVYDVYRMIVGVVNGKYLVLTNADVVLSRYNNPNIPVGLLKVFNSF